MADLTEPSGRPRRRLPATSDLPLARAAIAAALALIVTVVAWRTGGFFTADSDERNLTVVRLMLFAALALFFFSLPTIVRRAGRAARIAFLAWAAYLGVWLFALWPGIVMSDSIAAVDESRRANVFEWFSWIHSALNIAVLDLVPHIGALAVLQIVLVAGTMAFATQALLSWRASVPAAVAMNVVAALSAPIVVNALLLSRDTPFALGHVLLSLLVAQLATRQREATAPRIAVVVLLTGWLSVYRGDGIVLLVVVPLLLLFALRPARAAVLRGAAAFAGVWILFAFLLPATLDVQDQSRAYAVSLRVNPLGAVLQSDFYSADREHDLRELGRVINVAEVRDTYTPAEIPAYWSPTGWNRNASDADFAAFKKTADRLMLENVSAVLGGRVRTFGAATGLGPGQFIQGSFDATGPGSGDAIAARPPSHALHTAAEDAIERTEGWSGAISTRGSLFWNFLPWLALLLCVLPFWKRAPFPAAFALIVLCRVPVVFLVSPAAQFKYYLSVELGGIVLLGMLLALVRREALRSSLARLRQPRATEPAPS